MIFEFTGSVYIPDENLDELCEMIKKGSTPQQALSYYASTLTDGEDFYLLGMVEDDVINELINRTTPKAVYCDLYDRKTKTYKRVTLPQGTYLSFSDNMDAICTCPCCGKDYKYGDMYSSSRYFHVGGVFSFYVCEECYEKE